MTEWQPIETAPKDGSSILVYHAGGQCVAYWWMDHDDPDGEYEHWDCCGIYVEPTYWMPLPEPPK